LRTDEEIYDLSIKTKKIVIVWKTVFSVQTQLTNFSQDSKKSLVSILIKIYQIAPASAVGDSNLLSIRRRAKQLTVFSTIYVAFLRSRTLHKPSTITR
jgi:hypothetical protein